MAKEKPKRTHGAVGSPIEGSALVRDYCADCAVPIRVCPGDLEFANFCSGCEPTGSDAKLTPRQREGSAKTRS